MDYFPAIRLDRVPFEKTVAIIFRSLEDIKSRFVEFWELLSRQRVIEGNLESALFGEEKITTKPQADIHSQRTRIPPWKKQGL